MPSLRSMKKTTIKSCTHSYIVSKSLLISYSFIQIIKQLLAAPMNICILKKLRKHSFQNVQLICIQHTNNNTERPSVICLWREQLSWVRLTRTKKSPSVHHHHNQLKLFHIHIHITTSTSTHHLTREWLEFPTQSQASCYPTLFAFDHRPDRLVRLVRFLFVFASFRLAHNWSFCFFKTFFYHFI